VNSNSSLNIPIADYLNASCTGEPCSNSTLSYATKVILDSCQTELVKSNVENKTVISYFESYPLIREMLCLKTTDPFNGTLTAEHDPKHKANWTAFTPSEINFTHPYWNTSFATSELPTNGSANPKRENGGAAAETTPVPQVIEPDSQTGTDQTTKNASYCLLSLVNEYETYVGHNLTVPWIAGIATGSNQTAINASNHIPVEAICTECVYGALDLAAQGSPWLANLTIGNNYTLFSFVNETCFDLGFRINNNGTLPKSILPGAVNSTYGHNITYFNASLAQASGGAGGSSNTSDLSDWFTRVAPNSTGNISNVTDETPSDAAPSTTYTYTTTITDANGSAVPSVVTGTETLTSGAVTTPAPSASGGAGSATASGDASATASGSAAPSGEVSGSAVPSAEPSGSAAPSAEPSAEPSGSAAASQEPSAVTSEAPAASETATNTDTMSANASTAPARFALRRHARDWRL
jgi:hypothetical protein